MANILLQPIPHQAQVPTSISQSEQARQAYDMMQIFYGNVGYELPWVGYWVMHENDCCGLVSFVGQPQEGKAEISYWIFDDWQGKGLAKAACRALVQEAMEAKPGLMIEAKTMPVENASTAVLRANGFALVGSTIDHEIGEAWLWQRRC